MTTKNPPIHSILLGTDTYGKLMLNFLFSHYDSRLDKRIRPKYIDDDWYNRLKMLDGQLAINPHRIKHKE